jgi:hypothetical protein
MGFRMMFCAFTRFQWIMSAATLGSPDFFGFLGFSICSLEISLG